MVNHFLLAVLILLPFAASNHEHSLIGFLSIDCGYEGNDSYTDETTSIIYTSDANFTDAGVSRKIAPLLKNVTLGQQLENVRSFPDGRRNCYILKPAQGKSTKYLIRASFMYGNYDGANNLPSEFEVHLDADVWDIVKFTQETTVVTMEIIYLPQRNYIHVCLVDTDNGTPFISLLELRPLENSTYVTESRSLVLQTRADLGSSTNKSVRYPEDAYDRIWQSYNSDLWVPISTSFEVVQENYDNFNPPKAVMTTAVIPLNNNSIWYTWYDPDTTVKFYMYFYFAEVQKLQHGQTREFNIFENDDLWQGPISPVYLTARTISTLKPWSNYAKFSINKTEMSTLPPLLNAVEIYTVKEILTLLTDQQDADGVTNIKSQYGVKRNWQGDPCSPILYLWNGLGCSYGDNDPPRITLLNLSSSGLSGGVSPYISGLTALESLDLSNNSLTGPVPSFLVQLTLLKFLNLKENNLTGSVPSELVEKVRKGLLVLSVDDNICQSTSCEKNKKKWFVPVVAAAAVGAVLLIALAAVCILKSRK